MLNSAEFKKLMNKQNDIQFIINIIRDKNNLEFEKKLYKLRLTYIKQANLLFKLQQLENEIFIINRGLIILDQNKDNNAITGIINTYYLTKLFENKKKINNNYEMLNNNLKLAVENLSNYITPNVLQELYHIRKDLLDILKI